MSEQTIRKIIHIDMDAFYASVEQRDNPVLKGRPVVVGGQPDSRGVVAACSYEARKFGIHSAMPCSRAYRLCPDAVFVPPRFEVYRDVSRQINTVFHQFTELVEPLSLDEAYLDVSQCGQCNGSATLIAREIKSRIRERTGLTASAGVSYNKFLAKTASDMDKPDGLYVILPDQGEAFVAALPIGKFFGIGRVTEGKMKKLGIHTGADLRSWPLDRLVKHFGKAANYYFHVARGIDNRQVHNRRERKSIGSERTFAEDLVDIPRMLEALNRLALDVSGSLEKRGLLARTLTIKVKYADFQQVTRSITRASWFGSAQGMVDVLPELLSRTQAGERAVRLLGVSVSGLHQSVPEIGGQLGLFELSGSG